ncbi:uncharacterized protein LOC122849039 [Aphidius gifuensis]|uniref:uncharacterized protein LOC122849039 n=1 Tax=Aphidius gifuensis TaxID=684658 RepID=UPI001CDBC0F7|nr:uncharacterized protein LOC122849039 [Aphidius gifuensis]
MISARKIYFEEDPQTSDEADNHQKVDINSLNYDSLAQIFMLLPIAERMDMEKVCTKWKEAAPLAWCNIKKYKCETSIGRSYDNRLLTQSYLEKILLKCGFYLNELTLSNICHSSIMPFVGDHCQNLTRLEFEFYDNPLTRNANHFVQAFTLLDKLKYIKLKLVHNYSNKAINLFEIVQSLPEGINEIHLYFRVLFKYSRKKTDSMVFKKFNNLQKLTIHGAYLDDIICQEIAEKKTLVHLDIELHHIHEGFLLLDKLVNLKNIELFITKRYFIDDEVTNDLSNKVMNSIFCTSRNLKHLDMTYDHYDINEFLFNKWINLQNLQFFGIKCDITLDLANKILEYCKNLKDLKIPCTSHSALEILTKLENLESLIIYGDVKLTEKSITAISNNCKKLKRLEMFNCSIVPSHGDLLSSPSVLDGLSKLKYLEHLDLMNAENLEDSTIIAVANNCKNLKYLNISRVSTITETALVALTNLENLQVLDVSFLERITDDFIIKLKGLKELYCTSCINLTDTGIIQVIKNNPDLQELDIACIDNITIDSTIAHQATKNRTNGIILHTTAYSLYKGPPQLNF